MRSYYDGEVFVPKGKVFSNEEDERKWCEDWEKTRKALIERFGKRLDHIYIGFITKEAKA